MSDISIKHLASIDDASGENKESLKKIPEKYQKDYLLVQNILNHDESSWNSFVTETQNFLYFTIRKVINKTKIDRRLKEKALDLAEDLFLDFYEHLLKKDMHLLRMYKGNSKLSSYLYVCISNFVYDFFKSKKWKSYSKSLSESELNGFINSDESEMSISEIAEKFSDGSKESYNPEKELYKKEISEAIEELVSSLSKNEQLCFNLLFVDGLKPSEASLILGMSSFDVSQMKYKIKEKLKKAGKDKLKEFLKD